MVRTLCIVLLSIVGSSVTNAGSSPNVLSNSTNGTIINTTAPVIPVSQGGRASGGGRANAIDIQQGGRAGGGRAGAALKVPLPKGPPPKTDEELNELKEMLPDHLWSKYGMTEQAKKALLRGEEIPTWEG